jgi:Cytochrome c7 and related cytochrome c
MSQIFPKSANAWSKASIGAVLGLVVTIGAGVGVWQRSDYLTAANAFKEQPVQFSHQHHVGGIGIDCRYCHTAVEVSSSAGIPPTKTCINCHSQIWSTSPYLEPVRSSFRDDRPLRWLRVHDLPDFVYFNHSIHVKKGMGCETCHGRVDRMPLMRQQNSLQMEWCLDCHRNPEQYVRPRTEVFTMGYTPAVAQSELGPQLVAEYKIQSLTNCSVCHR